MNLRGSVARARKTGDEPTFVPLLQLLLIKVCRVLQLLELLLRQLGLAVFTKLSAQLLRRGCGLLCLGVGIQGLVLIGRGWGGGMMQWLVGPWSRGRKSKPQPRASDDGACRPPVQLPVARSRASSDCLRGGGGDQGNGKYGMRDAGATHDFPMSATETTTEEEMGRRAIDGESTFPQEEKREVGGTLRSIGGAGKDTKRVVGGQVVVATESG